MQDINRLVPSTWSFALLAAAFEGGLAIFAVGLGWLLGYPPLATLRLTTEACRQGFLAVLPPLILLAVCVWKPLGIFAEVMRAVDELVVPLLKDCRMVEVAIVSLLAGLGEEMLFRGVLQASIADWIRPALAAEQGPAQAAQIAAWLAAIAVAVLFGLMHYVNRGYALVAGLIGLYLGWLWIATGNLLAPIITHAVYDFLAIEYLVKVRRIDTT